MKKKFVSLVAALFIMLFGTTINTPVCASEHVSVTLNGKALSFSVEPQIINGTTMVPMRAIFEALGYTVSWNSQEQTISAYAVFPDLFIAMGIGKNFVMYGDYTDYTESGYYSSLNVEIAPLILNGTTLIPVRAVSEASGCEVTWDGTNKTVHINTPTSITSNSEYSIKNYLRYNYNQMIVGDRYFIMRYRIFKNQTTTLPFDYNIVMRTSDGIPLLKTIKTLNTMTNEEKQMYIDTYQSFEEKMAKDVISQLPTQKFMGSYANNIGDKYTYMSWTNYGDVVYDNYNNTKAGEFTWSHSNNYGEFDFNEYFTNIKTNLPWTYKNKLLDTEATITDIKFGETSATKNGKDDDHIFVKMAIISDRPASLIYMNCYDIKGNYLDSQIVSVSPNTVYQTQLLHKDTAKIIFSDKKLSKEDEE